MSAFCNKSLAWVVAVCLWSCGVTNLLAQSSGGASSPRANVSWSVDFVGGVWKVSGTVTVTNSGGRYGVAVLDPVTGNGGTKNGDRVASYDGSISAGSFPYEYALTPGHWYRWIANDSEGPGQNYDQDTTFFLIPAELLDDCKASVNITNPYGVPTWFRVQHSIDGELGRVLLQPGQAWVQEWEVTCGGNFVLAYQPQGNQELDGVWFYPEDEEAEPDEEAWEDGEPVEDGDPEEPAPETPPPPSPAQANLPQKSNSPTEAWQPAPDPVDTDDLLDRKTFREGVDKLVKAVRDAAAVGQEISDKLGDPSDGAGEGPEAIPTLDGDLDDVDEELKPPNPVTPGGTEILSKTMPHLPTPSQLLPGVDSSSGTIDEIEFDFPGFTFAGREFPAFSWSFSLTPYAFWIAVIRNLLACLISVYFFFKVVETIKGSSV